MIITNQLQLEHFRDLEYGPYEALNYPSVVISLFSGVTSADLSTADFTAYRDGLEVNGDWIQAVLAKPATELYRGVISTCSLRERVEDKAVIDIPKENITKTFRAAGTATLMSVGICNNFTGYTNIVKFGTVFFLDVGTDFFLNNNIITADTVVNPQRIFFDLNVGQGLSIVT